MTDTSVKLRLYLDTSVFCAYFDERVTDRQLETKEFWRKIGQFEVTTSELTSEEISQTPDPNLKDQYNQLLRGMEKYSITEEMRNLANEYISAGVFTPTMFNDSLHVAAAVLTRQDILLSWNFKHLVNRRRRAMINQLNISRGLPTIEIVAPPEI